MLVVSEDGLGEDMADPAEIKLTRCMVQGLLEGTALRETLSPTDTVREAGIFTVQDGTGVGVGVGVLEYWLGFHTASILWHIGQLCRFDTASCQIGMGTSRSTVYR